VWNDLLLVLGVPVFDSSWADVMNSISESDALTQVPAGGLAELAGAPIGELGKVFHDIPIYGELN
jgi:hypothetical protein